MSPTLPVASACDIDRLVLIGERKKSQGTVPFSLALTLLTLPA